MTFVPVTCDVTPPDTSEDGRVRQRPIHRFKVAPAPKPAVNSFWASILDPSADLAEFEPFIFDPLLDVPSEPDSSPEAQPELVGLYDIRGIDPLPKSLRRRRNA
jgi:hypothetical protein